MMTTILNQQILKRKVRSDNSTSQNTVKIFLFPISFHERITSEDDGENEEDEEAERDEEEEEQQISSADESSAGGDIDFWYVCFKRRVVSFCK